MAFVVGNALAATGPGLSISVGSTISAANYGLFAVTVNNPGGALSVSAVSDGTGNVWTQIASNTSNLSNQRFLWRTFGSWPSTTITVTATLSSGATSGGIAVAFFSGRTGSSPEDGAVQFGIDGVAGTSHSLSSVTASAGDDLAAFLWNGGATTTIFTAGSGWTRRGSSSAVRENFQTQNNVSAGSIQDTFTTSSSETISDIVVAILPAVAIPLPLGLPRETEVVQTHGPSVNKYLNANTSQGTSSALIPFVQPPLVQCNFVVVLQTHHPSGTRQLNQDTSQGTPKTLYADVARPRVAVLQNQPMRRDVLDTSKGTPLALLVVIAPPTGPPPLVPQFYRWLPADTSQGTSVPLRAGQAPFENAPAPVPPLYPSLPADTSQSAKALLSGDFFVPRFNPPQFQVDPTRPVVDTSSTHPKVLYADALTPAFNPPQFQVDAVRPVYDTSHGTPAEEIQPPIANPEHFPPVRFWWQPLDCCQATPKTLYGDLYAAAIPAPTLLVDAVRQVVNTSSSSPVAALSAQAPFTAEPGWAPYRFWWQPADTTQATAKPLYSDALTPVVNAPQFQVDPIRPVYDTSRGTAIEEIQPPLFNAPWFPPQRFFFQPADASQSTAKVLYGDQFKAFFNPPQYQIDPIRPVYDTSHSTPAEEIQPPIANPPWFAPQRFWWQPPDTSAGTPKTLYADLFAAVVDAPRFLIDAIRPVADTSRSTPTVLIPVQAPFIAEPWCPPLRFFWQPADSSQSTPKVGYADANRAIVPPPTYQVDPIRPVVDTSKSTPVAITAAAQPFQVLAQPAPLRFWWQPADTSLSAPKTLYADSVTPVFNPPQHQVDRIRPVVDTSSTVPKALYGDALTPAFDAPVFQVDSVRPVADTSRGSPPEEIQAPLSNPPWFAPLKVWWQPADTSLGTPKTLYGDALTPAVNAPQFQVDRVRPVTDTSQSTPRVITAAPIPFQVLEQPAPARFWWQPPDTSGSTPKAAYGDLTRAVVPPPSYQVDSIRPVVDTSRGSPDTLTQAPPTFTPPPRLVDRVSTLPDTSQSSFALLHQTPFPPTGFVATPPYVWLPADTTRGTPSLGLLPRPVSNAPQFLVDAIRPVYDTSRSTPQPLLATVQYPFLAEPYFTPLRFWWQPVDTSQAAWPPLFGFVPGNPYILVIESRQIDSLIDHTQTFMVIPSRQIDAVIDPVQTFTICQEDEPMPGGLILEKRSYDSRPYDLILTRLLPLGVTVGTVNQVLAEPASAALAIGSAVVNTQPSSYFDENGNFLLTAPPGTVIQVRIGGGVLPPGSGGQLIPELMCTIRAQFTDSSGNNVEATALLNLTNYVQAV